MIVLNGAGGGAGGADQDGAGGVGASGSQLVVELPVQPGKTAVYDFGLGGASGVSYTHGFGSAGGVGGIGTGNGGDGGAAPISKPSDVNSGSGGGGGGGGASYLGYDGTMFARAGGGGGGGGGSWARDAYTNYLFQPTAAASTNDCFAPLQGQPGVPGADSGNERGGGGGGGGGGGYFNQPSPAGNGGARGWDGAGAPIDGAHNGETGGSCHSPGMTPVSFAIAGGAAGSSSPSLTSNGMAVPPVAAPGADGSVTIMPVMDKAIAVVQAGDGTVTLNATLPASIPDTSVVTGYSFTCNPQLGGSTPYTVTTIPTGPLPAVNGSEYTCTVVVTVKDPNGGPDLSTSTSDPASATPVASPLAPPVANSTSGDQEGTVGVASLPPNVQPSDVKDYTVSCTPDPANAIVNPVSNLPLVITGLTNGSSYSCTVIANLVDGRSTPASAAVPINPTTVPVATATPVPGLGALGLGLLSAVMLALGVGRNRKMGH
ncbi:hypothetical protein [Comamonas koreensis]|uniref:hypothetical protein n=1 Tax=Comamonas koreensis TaxID=160825 RepID=UPI0015FAE192|nr:hypothetical protein [Comamonas koreensis]